MDDALRRLGLDTPLGGRRGDEWIDGLRSEKGEETVERLREKLTERVTDINDTGRVTTALGWALDFVAATGRVLFVDPSGEGGKRYNRESLDLYAEFIRETGSKQKGKRAGATTQADTIAGYVSALKVTVERRNRRAIVTTDDDVVRPVQQRQFRKDDGPKGARQLSRGLRAHHFRALVEAGYDLSSARGRLKWAAALLAHNLLLRGGEIGRSDKRPFDAARGITWGSFDWKGAPCAESCWREWLVVWICASKDPEWRHSAVAMPICRRSLPGQEMGADPLCVYDALRATWSDREMCEIGGYDEAAPFFVAADGVSAWRSTDTKELAREMARTLKLPPDEFGAKFARIGGATDLREQLGDVRSIDVIKERGRWGSDIHRIYQRSLLKTQLWASRAIGDAASTTRDMEEAVQGWVQPTTFR